MRWEAVVIQIRWHWHYLCGALIKYTFLKIRFFYAGAEFNVCCDV